VPGDEVVVKSLAVPKSSDISIARVDIKGYAWHENEVEKRFLRMVGVGTAKYPLSLVNRGWVDAGDTPPVRYQGFVVSEIPKANHVHDAEWQTGRRERIFVKVRYENLFSRFKGVSYDWVCLYFSIGHR